MIHTPKAAAKYIRHPAHDAICILPAVFPEECGIVVNLCRQNRNLFMFIATEQNIESAAVIEPCHAVVKRIIGKPVPFLRFLRQTAMICRLPVFNNKNFKLISRKRT